MGRLTTYRPLPDAAYDPRVTDLDNPVRPPKGRMVGPDGVVVADTWKNRNRSNTTPFQLAAGGPSTRAFPKNERRTGLVINNKDAAASCQVSFGNDQGTNGVTLAPGATMLLDFTTPNDEMYLFSAAAILVTVIEISRGIG